MTPDVAERDYGVVLRRDGASFAIDPAATEARRNTMKAETR